VGFGIGVIMINNPESVSSFHCNKILANYLIYRKHLPLLSIKNKRYYFALTWDLRNVLDNLPFWLEVAQAF